MCHLYNFVIIYKHSNNPKNSIFKIGLFFVVIFSPFLGIFFFPTFLHIMFLLPKLFPSFYYQSILPLPLYFINPHPPFDTFSPRFLPSVFFEQKNPSFFFFFRPNAHTHTQTPQPNNFPPNLYTYLQNLKILNLRTLPITLILYPHNSIFNLHLN